MSRTFYFGNFAKRKNSTLQPTAAQVANGFNVLFKTPTSLDNPTLTLTHSGDFDYNYAKYGNNYYFVTDKKSLHNDMWEVTLEIDPLATHKTEILASTQFVSYSGTQGDVYLADTRIPLLKSASVQANTTTMNFLFSDGGFYVLSVVGKTGCDTWACDASKIAGILAEITNWSDDLIDEVLNGHYPWSSGSSSVSYDFTTPQDAIESMAKMNMLTGFAGNAYSDAPSCIRSCIWVPFFPSQFAGNSGNVYLGQFDTDVTTFKCKTTPVTNTVSVTIPWQHSDWRKAVCEEVYLYLPLVGLVNVPSDELINETTITVEWSATATDGCVAYRVKAGSQVIGSYGANCAVNYPIGVSQQASAGEIVQTAFAGAQKTVSSAISAISPNPVQIASGAVNTAFNAVDSAYQTADAMLTRHNSCIGGIGGGAGVGLSLDMTCFTVSHETIIPPVSMKDTMGLPTMMPLTLSTLPDGYIQCANAHVALNADAPIMNVVDYYLNSGFFKE